MSNHAKESHLCGGRRGGFETTPLPEKVAQSQSTVSFGEALTLIHDAATKHLLFRKDAQKSQPIPLVQSLGRVLEQDIIAQRSFPIADTSAMDGYAVATDTTGSASKKFPVVLRIASSVLAGQADVVRIPIKMERGYWPCVEIATGARLPAVSGEGENLMLFDAVIPYERTLPSEKLDRTRYVQIHEPAKRFQHLRPAGGDITTGEIVVHRGTVLKPQHIMALASLGIEEVPIRQKLRIGVWSTGNELVNLSPGHNTDASSLENLQDVFDANGPFMIALLQSLGIEATFLGVLQDDSVAFKQALEVADQFDILITTGAVSMGRNDFVRPVLERAGAHIVFHKVKMRPGHPVLFATLGDGPRSSRAFFGLPGNPIAAAVCARFLLVPYLRVLLELPKEKPGTAIVQISTSRPGACESTRQSAKDAVSRSKPCHLDTFWHGQLLHYGAEERFFVSQDQSPAKVGSFSRADAWIHIPEGCAGASNGDALECYSLVPS